MNVGAFFLAESAAVRRDGTFDVTRGGIAQLAAGPYPAQPALAAVLVIEFGPDEPGPQEVEIQLRDANAGKLQLWRYPFMLAPNQRAASLVLNLKGLRLPEPADYLLNVRVNGKHAGAAKTLKAL
jgi:hypothetical protein